MVGRGSAAAAYDPGPGGHELASIARHIFRRTQIDVSAFHGPRNAGIRLSGKRQGSERSHTLDCLQHGNRTHTAVTTDYVGAPIFQSRSEGSRIGAIEAIAVFIDRN